MVEATTEDYGIMDSILRTDGMGLPFLHMKAGEMCIRDSVCTFYKIKPASFGSVGYFYVRV